MSPPLKARARLATEGPSESSLGSSKPTWAKGTGLNDLKGKRAAVLLFSQYPSDPRPRREAEALADIGMQVDVVCLRQHRDDRTRETFGGINVLRLPLKHWRGGKAGYFFQYACFILACFFVLAFRSLRRRYDLVHVHNMPDVLVFAALVPKVLGAKVILDLHDPMPELMMTIFGLGEKSFAVHLLKKLEKWSIALADSVFTPNAAFERLFAARSCRPDKLRVVMNSPDERIFPHLDANVGVGERQPGRPFVIMFHGSLVERHGLDTAVEALASIRSSIPSAELRIFGQPTPFVQQVLDLAASRGLNGSVRYLGCRTLEQIVREIDSCDVGIIPNRRSVFTEINMPTRIFEYLSRAKPVIAPLTTGIQDYFTAQTMIFFQPGNSADLASKLQYVFLHPQEAQQIIRRGQSVYARHKWSKERVSFLARVCDLLGRRSRVKRESL